MFSNLSNIYNSTKDVLYQMLPQNIKTVTNVPEVATPKMNAALLTAKIGSSYWIKVAAISGCAAVCFGAYGAHGLKLKTPEKRAIFETANKYHFYHSIALLLVPVLKRPNLIGSLFTLGILIFSGTCYCNAITGSTEVVRYTPIGGFFFIFGWLSMLF